MPNADQSHDDGRPRTHQRGASESAIASVLHRDPHPGPQHWGGPRPRRAERDPFRLPRPAVPRPTT